MEKSQELQEIAKALSKFQGEIHSVKKDKENPYYKSAYSDLASIWGEIRPYLASNGLCVLQEAVTVDIGVSVSTVILHSSGQFIEFAPLTVPVGKRDAHSIGSATTYSKRYALCAALGIVSDNEDDDGNRAVKSGTPPPPPKKKVKEFSQKEMDSWVTQWSEKYSLTDIEEFCQARADHFSHSIQMTCAELSQDEKIFVKNIDTWLKKNSGEKS